MNFDENCIIDHALNLSKFYAMLQRQNNILIQYFIYTHVCYIDYT